MNMLKIGPHLSVAEENYLPTMQDAYQTDIEEGASWLNDLKSKELNDKFPTVVAMASLIEKQRDGLQKQVNELQEQLKRKDKK